MYREHLCGSAGTKGSKKNGAIVLDGSARMEVVLYLLPIYKSYRFRREKVSAEREQSQSEKYISPDGDEVTWLNLNICRFAFP